MWNGGSKAELGMEHGVPLQAEFLGPPLYIKCSDSEESYPGCKLNFIYSE